MSWDHFEKPSASFFRSFRPSYLKSVFQLSSLADAIFMFRYHLRFDNLRIKLGWKTLLKYQSCFSRFLLLENPGKDGNSMDLFLIDTVLFKENVQKYLKDFREILQEDSLTPDSLLEEVKKRPLFEVLNWNEMLFGILLGFGKGNAVYYEQSQKKRVPVLDSAWEAEVEQEHIAQFNQKFFSFEPWDFSVLFYPQFSAVHDSDETRELKIIYRAAREQFIEFCEGKEFVDASLSLLSKHPP